MIRGKRCAQRASIPTNMLDQAANKVEAFIFFCYAKNEE